MCGSNGPMTLLRRLARPLLASVFIVDGWDAMRHPERHAEKLQPYTGALKNASEKVPGVPEDTVRLARISGAVSVGAGVLLATGRMPRLAAGVLAAVAVPVAVLNRPQGDTPQERRAGLSAFLRSAGLIGGLIIAASDREGEPSLRWKRQNAQDHRAELAELKSDLRAQIKAAKAA